jgi:hypothetical protein
MIQAPGSSGNGYPEADLPNGFNGSGAAKGIGPKSGRFQAQTAWLSVVFSALRK